MVVAGSVGREVAKTVDGDSVLGSAEAQSSGISGDLARGHVVGGLSTEEETITANNGVSSEGGAL